MKLSFVPLVTLVSALAVVSAHPTVFKKCQARIENMVVFGDSYSDIHNVFIASKGTWPSPKNLYYNGRFSNGPNWADYVTRAKRYRLQDYAYGGATADAESVQGYSGADADIPVPGFIQQVENYDLIKYKDKISKTLFALSFQGNDFIFDTNIDPLAVLANVERGIRTLVEGGAKHILVIQNCDIGAVPYFAGDPAVAASYSARAAKEHEGYKSLIAKLTTEFGESKEFSCKEEQVTFHFLDLFAFFKKLSQPHEMRRMGITELTRGCVSNDYKTRCPNPNQFFYYDGFHPSTKVHYEIAKEVLKLLKKTAIAAAAAFNSVAVTVVFASPIHNHRNSNSNSNRGCKKTPNPRIEEMVVFGDSFSDTGNVWQLTKNEWPLDFYYKGRFSNGPVWSEYVAKAKGVKLTNYAFGSATTDSTVVQGVTGPKSTIPVPGFIQQIEDYYVPQSSSSRHRNKSSTNNNKKKLDKTLFVVNLQGNEWSFAPSTQPQQVVDNLEKGIRRLVDLGATRFLFFKNQDYGLIPYTINDTTTSQAMSQIAEVQSRAEQEMLTKLEKEFGGRRKKVGCNYDYDDDHHGIDIRVVDIRNLFEQLKTNPRLLRKLGISDVKGSCVSFDYSTVCRDPKKFFFYDGYHVSTVVHRQVAEAALKVLEAH
ncbi:hypothetical protein BG004_008212 [Podila humilis]|nr:hypothetical protein BG004_008212 [Podila humilis]